MDCNMDCNTVNVCDSLLKTQTGFVADESSERDQFIDQFSEPTKCHLAILYLLESIHYSD